MDTLDYNKILDDFQYKPNFVYRAFEQDGKWLIRIVMYVENARGPWMRWQLKPIPEDEVYYSDFRDFQRTWRSRGVGYSPSREMIEIFGTFQIPQYGPEDEMEFVTWLVFQIQTLEEHETFEWLRYKGELINDPHKAVVPNGRP